MVIYDRARSTLCDLPFLKPNYRDAPFSPTPARDTSGINDEADTEVSEDDDDGMIEEREAQPLVQDGGHLDLDSATAENGFCGVTKQQALNLVRRITAEEQRERIAARLARKCRINMEAVMEDNGVERVEVRVKSNLPHKEAFIVDKGSNIDFHEEYHLFLELLNEDRQARYENKFVNWLQERENEELV